jgi:hypothetical protein
MKTPPITIAQLLDELAVHQILYKIKVKFSRS